MRGLGDVERIVRERALRRRLPFAYGPVRLDHLACVGDVVRLQGKEHLVGDLLDVGDAAGLFVDRPLEKVAGETGVAEHLVAQRKAASKTRRRCVRRLESR